MPLPHVLPRFLGNHGQLYTPLQFAGHLAALATMLPMADRVALDHAGRIVRDEARRALGTYDYGWPQLADSTQADRARQGYPDNEPLLRTGQYRDSIQYTVGHRGRPEVDIGTDDERGVWFQFGTARMPPRPHLAEAAIRMQSQIEHAVGRVMHAYISGWGITRLAQLVPIIGRGRITP